MTAEEMKRILNQWAELVSYFYAYNEPFRRTVEKELKEMLEFIDGCNPKA